MDILRSVRREAGSGVVQEVESANLGHQVYSNATVAENNGQTRTILEDDPRVSASRPGTGRNVPKSSKAHVYEENLNCDKLTDRLVDGGTMHGPPIEDSCPEGSESKTKMGACSIPEDEAQHPIAASEKTETVRPVENKAKSYLKIYKENFRVSKKMKLATQFPATGRDLWKGEGISLEGVR
ncbi:hypothetical protein FRC11_007338 [Ceratobasidium sp. 423]|nr:hypothetical protein FRC11_007338 [Ceratobasidium sp. 423]